ncbi:MAG: lytic transglycosylase domain-containing protein [Burkholderiales bacterium]|nr:lytic transglycosylase domain-containing protein [Burkholderiales bacterium]
MRHRSLRCTGPLAPADEISPAPLQENALQSLKGSRTSPQWLAAVAIGITLPACACWDDAARRYNVSGDLLYAIARTESGLNPQAIGRNTNGSRDIGLMQINSAWLPTLASHGIGERDLYEPCTNIHVGAWILAGNVNRLGYTWEAVGAYNAANPARRRAYADKVRRHLPATATMR